MWSNLTTFLKPECNNVRGFSYNILEPKTQKIMKKKKLYRTVIQYEIISDEPYEGENLDEIVHETYNGSWSGEMKDAAVLNEELIGKKAVDAVKNQGSDPEFFFMDNGGNDISV